MVRMGKGMERMGKGMEWMGKGMERMGKGMVRMTMSTYLHIRATHLHQSISIQSFKAIKNTNCKNIQNICRNKFLQINYRRTKYKM